MIIKNNNPYKAIHGLNDMSDSILNDVENVEETLDVVLERRAVFGERAEHNERTKGKVDRLNDMIIRYQIQYRRLTGGFYSPDDIKN